MQKYTELRRHRMAAPYVGVVTLALLLAGCGAGGDNSDRDSVKNREGQPLVIGAALGFTGLLQPYEGEAFVTAELAAEDINAKGGVLGRKIQFVKADTKSDPNLAPTAASQLLEKKAEVVLTSDFDFGGPAALVAMQKNVLALSLHASPPKFGPAGLGRLAFSAGIMTPNEAAVAAEWAYNEKHWRKAYELEDVSIEYTRSFNQYFREAWKRLGGEFVGHDTFQNSDPSLAAQVTRLKGAPKPDFVLMTSYNPGGASAVRQIRSADLAMPLLSGQPMDGTYWLNAVPNLSEFYVSTYASFTGDDSDPFVNQLRERFKTKTGRYPTLGYFVNGYNAIDLLVKGIQRAGSVDGKKLADALEKFDGVETRPLGKTCFSAKWHVSLCRPFAIVAYQGGKPQFVGRFDAKEVPDPRVS